MKKITLTAMSAQKDALLQALLILGCVEVSEPAEPKSAAARVTGDGDRYRAELTLLTRALDVLQAHVPVKSKLFARREIVSADSFFDEVRLSDCLALASTLLGIDAELHRLNAEESGGNELIESLLPWETMAAPLELDGTRTCEFTFGALPSSVRLPQLQASLTDAVAQSKLTEHSRRKKQLFVSVIYLRGGHNAIADALRAAGFVPSPLRALTGTAGVNLARLRARQTEIDARRAELSSQITGISSRRGDLSQCAELVKTKLLRAQAKDKLVTTERTVTLTGRVPESDVPALTAALSPLECVITLSDPSPEERTAVVSRAPGAFARRFGVVARLFVRKSGQSFHPLGVDAERVGFAK
jgi:V/A-type H+-transporting ATPase subunit I